jgi:hypothetical protein
VAVAVGLVGVGGGLQGEQLGVGPAGGDELVVAAVFDDATVGEDEPPRD